MLPNCLPEKYNISMCLFTDVIRHCPVVRLGVDCVCLPLSFSMSAPQAFPSPGRRGSRAVPAPSLQLFTGSIRESWIRSEHPWGDLRHIVPQPLCSHQTLWWALAGTSPLGQRACPALGSLHIQTPHQHLGVESLARSPGHHRGPVSRWP